jgi:predicted dehydrogenase
MKTTTGLSRRQFIQRNVLAALAAATFPAIIPAAALGRNGAVAPSARVTVGAIGVGERGRQVLRGFLDLKQCQVVAVCDVKQDALAKAKSMVDGAYQNAACMALADFRDLTARADLDAVMIASPDHWHVLHALSAVRAGKDVYVEKPLGLSLEQDQALQREVVKRRRVFQFGTQQRSGRMFRLACELVRNGHIGKLRHINLWAPPSPAGGSTQVVPPPSTLDYNSWLGPAPFREHTENLTVNSNWWHVSDFALGFIAGWGIHPLDIALWGAGKLAAGTVELAGLGIFPQRGLHDTATAWDIDFKFDSGLTLKSASAPGPGTITERLGEEWTARYGKLSEHGTVFEGEDGWILVDRNKIVTRSDNLVELDLEPEKLPHKLVRSPSHALNFIESVKSRQPTVSPIESAVQADALCHVSDLAIRLGRKLRYDPNAGKIRSDREANHRLQVRSLRPPWKL